MIKKIYTLKLISTGDLDQVLVCEGIPEGGQKPTVGGICETGFIQGQMFLFADTGSLVTVKAVKI